MRNVDETSPSISPAGHCQVVETRLITLEPHVTFWSNSAYLNILTLSSHYAKRGRSFEMFDRRPPTPSQLILEQT